MHLGRDKNFKSQIILCCCAYRHPNTELICFTDCINKILSKVAKENKLIFMMGDFNMNLLNRVPNYESHSDTNEFLNNMISH